LNPSILGLHYSQIHIALDASTSKKELIARLKLMPGVLVLTNWYGDGVGMILVYDNVNLLRNGVSLIQSLSNGVILSFSNVLWPECNMNMSITDWRIVRALQRDPRKSHSSIANQVRISLRTVERRLQRMVHAKALFAFPTLKPNALEGTILADLEVSYSHRDGPLLCRNISQQLVDYLWHMFFTVSAKPGDSVSYTFFNLALPSVAKANEILDSIKNERLAIDPRIELWVECFTLMQAQDHYLEARLSSLGID